MSHNIIHLMIENHLQQALSSSNHEKTFIDKLLAKDDIKKIGELMKKKQLTREELLEALYLLASSESKLQNFNEWERYVLLKFYVWIREFIKIAEILYNYKEQQEEQLKELNIKEEKEGKPLTVPSDTYERLLENSIRRIEHNAKFLIDLYLNISRTSLSVGGTGFMELLKNKFEMAYTQGIPNNGQSVQNNSRMGTGRN